ncbi:MAG: zf-TFIIB domain-containing protein [Deltaproteobacteria bacterium]|nr:zf-TFIIB domain-containing protein [Deltaproteobacteria bacterium]
MKKPPHPEDDYFAKVDLDNLKKLAAAKRAAVEKAELTRLADLHRDHCPGCGWHMDKLHFKGYPIHRCFHCGGTFLEKGTLEALTGEESHVMERIAELFKFS